MSPIASLFSFQHGWIPCLSRDKIQDSPGWSVIFTSFLLKLKVIGKSIRAFIIICVHCIFKIWKIRSFNSMPAGGKRGCKCCFLILDCQTWTRIESCELCVSYSVVCHHYLLLSHPEHRTGLICFQFSPQKLHKIARITELLYNWKYQIQRTKAQACSHYQKTGLPNLQTEVQQLKSITSRSIWSPITISRFSMSWTLYIYLASFRLIIYNFNKHIITNLCAESISDYSYHISLKIIRSLWSLF